MDWRNARGNEHDDGERIINGKHFLELVFTDMSIFLKMTQLDLNRNKWFEFNNKDYDGDLKDFCNQFDRFVDSENLWKMKFVSLNNWNVGTALPRILKKCDTESLKSIKLKMKYETAESMENIAALEQWNHVKELEIEVPRGKKKPNLEYFSHVTDLNMTFDFFTNEFVPRIQDMTFVEAR
ncbi:DUF38 domain-containing protein [Caenorhabditis elegans]|uniref:DUF38 domain-containing protein n=1 Tax=Caenorhabditis elegans TaxID=6239 RepID=Q9XU23_CAEEL|nr:DUF38 domain-containing protein [Caenorhabditis elegans]CAB07225.2 DUF38 domain-containing protein [Caenorhabditis elegans]